MTDREFKELILEAPTEEEMLRFMRRSVSRGREAPNSLDMKIRWIRFQGMLFVLVAGAIVAERDFKMEKGESFAEVGPNGDVRRHGVVIGTRDDIEVIGHYYEGRGRRFI